MAKSRKKDLPLPSEETLEKVIRDEKYSRRFRHELRGTISLFINIAAIAVIVAVLLRPVLRIYGDSMKGTLDRGNIVLSVRTSEFETGDIMAFYYNNNILVRRVIGHTGDWVDIDEEGNVFVNNVKLEEDYIRTKSPGETDVEYPYQVPEGRFFVLSDNRTGYADSRSSSFGDVTESQVIGKVIFRIWPFQSFGKLD